MGDAGGGVGLVEGLGGGGEEGLGWEHGGAGVDCCCLVEEEGLKEGDILALDNLSGLKLVRQNLRVRRRSASARLALGLPSESLFRGNRGMLVARNC